ncbi:nucleoside/nucleotide kinase family protein [Paracoccus aestuarii]|uniref:Nucleoside/nucleotide kinase family protein n=1 Tax=Paracoccus aestuarii TaxID=453842 RepID=A0A418ZQ40_9RHOB|nr:nucleoside/nucleotide kinase family protein [Paracoccus aestuarii]RJK97347.1 nucleoside/nucleotide kinase family protein [Paracoccus aestuarii]WCQ98216.1 nucleoside/nucleotide kinase family protein [Paracoccus aestuarii]
MTERIGLEALTARLRDLARGPGRAMVALAGPPGAGKSHVTDALLAAVRGAALLPMDGFHLDDRLLTARGDLARKGAPWTFDLDGFAVMLDRLAADDGRAVLAPVFDRDLEISRAAAREIAPEARLILVEGNYLLLDQPGWRDLARHFALSVMLDVPEPVLRARLAARWRALPPDQARAKLEGNDLPNMALVLQASRAPDVILPNG